MASSPAKCAFVCSNLQHLKPQTCSPLKLSASPAAAVRVQQHTAAVLTNRDRTEDIDGSGSPCIQQHTRTVPRSRRVQQRSKVVYDSEDEGDQPSRGHRILSLHEKFAAAAAEEEGTHLQAPQELHRQLPSTSLADEDQLAAQLQHNCTLGQATGSAADTLISHNRQPSLQVTANEGPAATQIDAVHPDCLPAQGTPSTASSTPLDSLQDSQAGWGGAASSLGGASLPHPDALPRSVLSWAQSSQEQQQQQAGAPQRVQCKDASLAMSNNNHQGHGDSIQATNTTERQPITPVASIAAVRLPGAVVQQQISMSSDSDTGIGVAFKRSVCKPATSRKLLTLFHDEDGDEDGSTNNSQWNSSKTATNTVSLGKQAVVNHIPRTAVPAADAAASEPCEWSEEPARHMAAISQQLDTIGMGRSSEGADAGVGAAAAAGPWATATTPGPAIDTFMPRATLAAPSPWSCFKPAAPGRRASRPVPGNGIRTAGGAATVGRQGPAKRVTIVLDESSEEEHEHLSHMREDKEGHDESDASTEVTDMYGSSEDQSDSDMWVRDRGREEGAVRSTVNSQVYGASKQQDGCGVHGNRVQGNGAPADGVSQPLHGVHLPVQSPAEVAGTLCAGKRTPLVGAAWPSAHVSSTWHQHVPHVLSTPPRPSAAVAVVGRQLHGTPGTRQPLLPAAAQASVVTAPARRRMRVTAEQKKFATERESIARTLYDTWNAEVFGNQLPRDLPIVWNPRLVSTAGQVVDDGSKNELKRGNHNKRIPCRMDLAPKVLTSVGRLRSTLAHEMCHVAAWAIDEEYTPQHGPSFKKWSQRLMEYDNKMRQERQRAAFTGEQHISTHGTGPVHAPWRLVGFDTSHTGRQVHASKLQSTLQRTDSVGALAGSRDEERSVVPAGLGSSGLDEDEDWPPLDITRLHSFETHMPYVWRCKDPTCGKEYTRHRQSIDPRRHACSKCGGQLQFMGKFGKNGQLLKPPNPEDSSGSGSGSRSPSRPRIKKPTLKTKTPQATPNKYRQFVQSNFHQEKTKHPPGTPAPTIMKALAAQWKEQKQQVVAHDDHVAAGAACTPAPTCPARSSSPVPIVQLTQSVILQLDLVSDSDHQQSDTEPTARITARPRGQQVQATSPGSSAGGSRSSSRGARVPLVATSPVPLSPPRTTLRATKPVSHPPVVRVEPKPLTQPGQSVGSPLQRESLQKQLAAQRASQLMEDVYRLAIDLRAANESDDEDLSESG